MKTDEKLHCGLKELVNFIQVDSRAKHGVRNITFRSLQWVTGCASWKHWTNNRIRIWFCKMPTEKEISTNETLNTSLSPVRIFITNSIRIEVMPECPSDLFSVLIQGLKDHAWSGRWHNRLPCLWSYRFEKKLSRTGCNYQAEIQTWSLFALHVCVLQPQADFY